MKSEGSNYQIRTEGATLWLKTGHFFILLPVIYLTAYGDETIVKKASEIGNLSYIRKPLVESQVEEKIGCIL